jgi:hypothetical protein
MGIWIEAEHFASVAADNLRSYVRDGGLLNIVKQAAD